jgi:CheY-like chemotaxis protein
MGRYIGNPALEIKDNARRQSLVEAAGTRPAAVGHRVSMPTGGIILTATANCQRNRFVTGLVRLLDRRVLQQTLHKENSVSGKLNCVFDLYDHRFHNYHVLMSKRVREILLVAGIFDACILNLHGRIEDAIGAQYGKLGLSGAPRVSWATSIQNALEMLTRRDFDLVVSLPQFPDGDAFELARAVKTRVTEMPVMLLTPREDLPPAYLRSDPRQRSVDRVFTWFDSADGLFALIKSVEDRLNADFDAALAGVQVILLVDGSPARSARLLPELYREIIDQTRRVMEEGLTATDRLLRQRTRPKILLADSTAEAHLLEQQFSKHLMGVICCRDLPRNGGMVVGAGLAFLEHVRAHHPHVPVLLLDGGDLPLEDREHPPVLPEGPDSWGTGLQRFVQGHLGFGDFTFRLPDGREVARVADLSALANILPQIPDASILYHCMRHDFSRWLLARSEFILAGRLRRFTSDDFDNDPSALREFLMQAIEGQRRDQGSIIAEEFDAPRFDLDNGFAQIGQGSLGGKARGLAFLRHQLASCPELHERYAGLRLNVPPSVVLTTDVFDQFMTLNHLRIHSRTELKDDEIAALFTRARMPESVATDLRAFLRRANFPLAVRSSSLLEDSQSKPYAGIYRTVMLPNTHPELDVRLDQLLEAIQLVYASTFFEDPRAFAHRTGHKPDDEKMAVVIQKLAGELHGELFFPTIAGVAQSTNYYPMAPMKPEEGIAIVALGLGKTVVDGERSLRFCPAHPDKLPQFSTVEDILANAQRFFYGLRMAPTRVLKLGAHEDGTLSKQEVSDFAEPRALDHVISTYLPQEHRIKDGVSPEGHPVVTFAPVLKYNRIPLAPLLGAILEMGEQGMGCPVDVEFSVSFPVAAPPEVAILQIRPMSARSSMLSVDLGENDLRQAFCYSTNALGNGASRDLNDILFVKPEDFDPSMTPLIAREVGRLNAELVKAGRRYILIGPGRWGSTDPWLGIPVKWADISGTSVIVETTHPSFSAEPSQGSHFFHNMASLGMSYLTIREDGDDFLDWHWIKSQPVQKVTRFLSLVRVEAPVLVKVDGRNSQGLIAPGPEPCV